MAGEQFEPAEAGQPRRHLSLQAQFTRRPQPFAPQAGRLVVLVFDLGERGEVATDKSERGTQTERCGGAPLLARTVEEVERPPRSARRSQSPRPR
ncbi:hypothetical protein [Streptomyces galbus]|uniref:hypothetical protein n=1 Tax=Streptomyces gottesmaniae TaxID=3075518 RepID=UPI0012FEC672